jgi:hypothetical protein
MLAIIALKHVNIVPLVTLKNKMLRPWYPVSRLTGTVPIFVGRLHNSVCMMAGWLSVGSTLNQQVSLSDGKQIPIQTISYYDDIKDFKFDPTKKQIQFAMPFNWNTTRLGDQKQIMVHQEVSIPKGNSLASQSYAGTINGIDVTKNLMVDPSNSTKNASLYAAKTCGRTNCKRD